MKKLLMLAACGLSFLLPAMAQTTTTVTGTIKDLTNAVATSGQITFELKPGLDSTISGSSRFVPSTVTCTINGSGLIKANDGTSACVVTQNTALTPSGTYYKVCIQAYSVSPGSCFNWYALSSTYDITTAVPTPGTMPAYTFLDLASAQAITGNKSFSGSTTFSGAITSSSTAVFKNLNAVRYADQWCTTAGVLDQTCIQNAINDTPAGGTVFIPTGTYVLTGTGTELILITKPINLIGAGWGTVLQVGAGVGAAVDVIHIKPVADDRGSRLADFRITPASGTPARYGIHFDTSVDLADGGIDYFLVDHILIDQLGSQAIYFNNPTNQDGFYLATVQNSYLFGGVLCNRCGDSLNFDHNQFSGTGIGIEGTTVAASTTVRITNNFFNPTGAAIHFGTGTAIMPQVMILTGNEFEVPTVGTTGSNGAYVDLDGNATSSVGHTIVENNSWQIANSSTLNSLRLNYASRTRIRDNTFGRGAGGSTDIVTTANAGATRIYDNDFQSATMAQALTDGAGAGQTLYTIGGQNLPDNPLFYRDNTGGTNFFGTTDKLAMYGGSNLTYIYDGAGNISFQCMRSGYSSCSLVGTGTVLGLGATASNHADTGLSRDAAGIVDVGNGTAQDKSGQVNAAIFNPTATVVGSLPAAAAGNKGQMRVVSDSTVVAAEGQTCAGGGAVTAMAFSNGTVWKCF